MTLYAETFFECIQTILSLLRYSGSSANFDSFISFLSCISKVKLKNLYQSNPCLHGSRVRLQVYIKNIDPYKLDHDLTTGYIYIYIHFLFYFLQGENYIPVQQTHKINAWPNHECTSKKIVTLTCVDEFGEIRRFTDS